MATLLCAAAIGYAGFSGRSRLFWTVVVVISPLVGFFDSVSDEETVLKTRLDKLGAVFMAPESRSEAEGETLADEHWVIKWLAYLACALLFATPFYWLGRLTRWILDSLLQVVPLPLF